MPKPGQVALTAQQTRALGLCRELNQIAHDIRIATGVLIDYEKGHNAGSRRFKNLDDVSLIIRMCVGWMVLALSRFDQLVDPYWDLIPEDQRTECAAIRREIARREVLRFRSSIIAHPFDGKRGPLVLPSQVNDRFVQWLGQGDTESWYRWICPWEGDDVKEPGVMKRVQTMRDAIALSHGISRETLVEALGH